jgi:hypothetical protein
LTDGQELALAAPDAEKLAAELRATQKNQPLKDRRLARWRKSALSGYPVAENGIWQAFVGTSTYQQLDLRALQYMVGQIAMISMCYRKRLFV